MKLPLALVFTSVFAVTANAAAAACPFQSDADVANTLAGSEWILTSERHYDVENNSTSIRRATREARLNISPVLAGSQLDDDPVDLVFQQRDMPESYGWEIGNITVTDAYPDITDAPCSENSLSMLLGQAPARLGRRQAELTLEIWVADHDRIVGLIRVERTDSFGNLHALYAPFEGAPAVGP